MNHASDAPDALDICRYWFAVWLGIVIGGGLFGGLVAYGFPIGWVVGAVIAGVIGGPTVVLIGGVSSAMGMPRSRFVGAVTGVLTGLLSLSLFSRGDLKLMTLVCLCGGIGAGFAACLGRADGFRVGRLSMGGMMIRMTWLAVVMAVWRLLASGWSA